MKTTATTMALLLTAMLAGSAAAAAPAPARGPQYWMKQQEFAADLRWYAPGLGDFDVYDQGFGVEFSYRHWFDDTFGIAGALGFESWGADGESGQWGGPVDGDLTLIPFGADGLMRLAEFDGATLVAQAGLRYAFASSDLTLGGDDGDSVDVGNSFVARAGLEIDFEIAPQASLAFGAGLQLDLSEGSAEAFGGDLESNHLEAFYLKAGLNYAF